MPSPTISIILPIYNVEQYLPKCLGSILRQDYSNYEVLMVDDGSPDNCPSICDEYAAKDNRFRVFHKENGGVSSARNVGLGNAQGEWIWYVDPDDWIKPHSLSILANAIAKAETDIVLFGIEYYNEELHLLYEENHNEQYGIQKAVALSSGDYAPPTVLVRHELIRKHHLRFTEGVRMGEDLEHQYKFMMMADRVTFIPQSLYCCLRREGSAMHNPLSIRNNAQDSIVTARNLADFIVDNHIREEYWLTARLQRKFKSVIAHNVQYDGADWKAVKECLHHMDLQLAKSDFRNFRTWQVNLALFSLPLYRFIFKLMRK